MESHRIIQETRKLDNPYDNLISDLKNIGISLVLLPKPKGCQTKALSYIEGNKIVIAIDEKLKDNKEFWHSLYHELGHLYLGHLKKTDINEFNEKEAEQWANLMLDN